MPYPGQYYRSRCRAWPGRTDEGVRPHTSRDCTGSCDYCVPEKHTAILGMSRRIRL